MFFSSEKEDLKLAQTAARDFFNEANLKPKVLSAQNISTFCEQLNYSFRLVFKEKEIIFFAALQWLVIGLAYTLWTRILDWIPDSIWDEAGSSGGPHDDKVLRFMELILVVWSFLIVAVASYPISILNAAMTASHYLNNSNQTSTIARCLNLAFKHLGRIWVFTTIDAWITVTAILDRLPKGKGHRTALDETLYYAWKIGTIGVLPSLVAGKEFIEAAADSAMLLRKQPLRAIGIRMGYSLICWLIGVTSYVGAVFYYIAFGNHDKVNEIYNFYLLMAVPLFIAVGVTSVLIRPFFLVMVSRLYSDVVPLNEKVTVPGTEKKFDSLALLFSIVFCLVLVLYFLGEQLGIPGWIESLAERDIYEYYRSHPYQY